MAIKDTLISNYQVLRRSTVCVSVAIMGSLLLTCHVGVPPLIVVMYAGDSPTTTCSVSSHSNVLCGVAYTNPCMHAGVHNCISCYTGRATVGLRPHLKACVFGGDYVWLRFSGLHGEHGYTLHSCIKKGVSGKGSVILPLFLFCLPRLLFGSSVVCMLQHTRL
jgi:hypothetical protein